MTISRNILVNAACLLLLLSACSKGEVFFDFHHLDKGMWYQDSLLVFDIDSISTNTEIKYDLHIEITNNRRYPYGDLWLKVNHNLEDTIFHNDTIHIRLINDNGKWLGNGVGGLVHISVPYSENISLAICDSTTGYKVLIGHAMGDNPLRGVEKIGVRLIEKQ